MADPDNGLRPMRPGAIAAHLTACLALVRPASMSDAAAEDWLTVAVNTLRDMPADLIEEGCAHARLNCTLCGQIIPAINRHVGERWEARKAMRARLLKPRAPALSAVRQPRWTATPDELEAIHRQAAARLRADAR